MTTELAEKSERMVAAIISRLAKNGVVRVDFEIRDLDQEDLIEERELFVDAFIWLENEGVVWSNTKHRFLLGGATAMGFTLTSYGYRLLNSRFEGDLTLNRAVERVVDTRKSYSGAGDFIGGILGGFTKSISG
jgi:hypothetical protein